MVEVGRRCRRPRTAAAVGAGDERRRRLLGLPAKCSTAASSAAQATREELASARPSGVSSRPAASRWAAIAAFAARTAPLERLGRVGPAVGGGCVAGLFGAGAELVGALAGGGGELLQRGSLLALGQRGGRGAVGARERRLGAGLGRRQVVGRGVVALVGGPGRRRPGRRRRRRCRRGRGGRDARPSSMAAPYWGRCPRSPPAARPSTAHGERVSACRALPAAGRLARGVRRGSAAPLSRRGLLGAAAARVRRPGGAAGRRRPGARRARRQPDRAHVHRRPLGRVALRGPAPGRVREPAELRAPRRRPAAHATPTITAVVRCAPPANKPTTAERDACLPWLVEELELLGSARVLLALGSFAWDGALRAVIALGHAAPRPKPRFGHGAEAAARPVPAARAPSTPPSRTRSPAS